MQPYYFVADSFEIAKKQIQEYCESINKPFSLTYNKDKHIVEVDRPLRTRPENLDGPLFWSDRLKLLSLI